MGRVDNSHEQLVDELVDAMKAGMPEGVARWMAGIVLNAIESLGWKVVMIDD